jgi:hypothetical protein
MQGTRNAHEKVDDVPYRPAITATRSPHPGWISENIPRMRWLGMDSACTRRNEIQ